MKIWKFPFSIADEFSLELPEGADILHTGLDPDGGPCLWAAVNPGNAKEQRKFRIYGTGHPINLPYHRLSHLGTMVAGDFVWHVFEYR